jgi:hypothetical protein
LCRIAPQLEVDRSILLGEEDILRLIAALRNMMRVVRPHHACLSCHAWIAVAGTTHSSAELGNFVACPRKVRKVRKDCPQSHKEENDSAFFFAGIKANRLSLKMLNPVLQCAHF